MSQIIEMAHSVATVQKASKENIVKKVNSLAWFVTDLHPTAFNTTILK